MPKLPASPLQAGWQTATIEGITFRPSTTNQNPMLEVEVALESGRLTSLYVIVTTSGEHIQQLLRVCGEPETAEAMRRKQNPAFELDDLIGRKLRVEIPHEGAFISSIDYPRLEPNAQRR